MNEETVSVGRDRGARGTASELFQVLVESHPGGKLALGEIVAALGDRGYGLLLLLFGLPALMPIPLPGLGGLFAVPLIAIAAQLAIGRPRPWLPRALLRREVESQALAAAVNRVLPGLRRLERLARPRLAPLTEMAAERIAGVMVIVLAVLLSLPVPLTNIPLALPVVLIALGLLERDGLLVLVGGVLGVAAGGFAIAIGWVLLRSLAALVGM